MDTPDTLRRILDTAATAVSADPGRARIVYRAAGTGTDGVRTEIRIRRHHVVVDEPAGLAGDDAAPSPVETALAALLSCQVVTYRVWAAKLGVPLDAVALDVEGDLDVRGFYGLDDAVRPGFGEVRVRVTLTGAATPERYRDLAAVVDEHCPVLDLFRGTTPVRTELALAGREGWTP